MTARDGGVSGGYSGMKYAIRPVTWCLIIGLVVLSNTVNVTSALFTPAARRGFEMWEIACWEGSSALLLILLVPLCFWVYARFPPRQVGLWRFAGFQFGFCLLFSMVHVAGMALIRKGVYALVGHDYDFTHGHPFLVFAYELRKDVVTYLIFLLFIWLDLRPRGIAVPESEHVPAAGAKATIELKVDGKRVYLAPAEITHIEAAGNYVEVYGLNKPLLVRATLGSFDKRLGTSGFARIHRSCLVNRMHVRSIDLLPSGDMQVTMKDGRVLSGSRRYREILDV